MSVVSVRAKDFILALFIRDDGERFLLGDNGYDFKDSQLHFSANTIENDEVQKQGADGVMLAGQVRRSSVQSFDGYVGDATTLKETIEEMRRDFIAFFAKGHHFRVIYIDTARNAWQRKGGYLVDAPEVKELYQIHPDYHVGLNFEDVNYYSYDEDKDGNEILSNLIDVPVSTDAEGGLVWDEDGAVSEDAGDIYYDTAESSASGKSIAISDATEAPLASFQLDGETSQQSYMGKNKLGFPNMSGTLGGVTYSIVDGLITLNGISTSSTNSFLPITTLFNLTAGDKAFAIIPVSGSWNDGWVGVSARNSADSQVTFQQRPYDGTHASVVRNYTSDMVSQITGFQMFFTSGSSFSNYKFYIQIVDGSTIDTTYEPFCGGTPSPNPNYPQAVQTVTGENVVKISDGQNEQSYEVNLGKNLFDKDDASEVINAYIDTAAHKIITGNSYRLAYIKCDPNTTYTISKTLSARFIIATAADMPANNVSVSQDIAKNTDTTYTITTNSTAKYLCVFLYHSSYDTLTPEQILASLQIEKGSQATSYAAYFEPIELCKIGGYQDSIYKSGSKWYVRKEVGKVVLNGGENWATALASIWGNNSYACTGITNFKSWGSTYSNYFDDAGLSQGAIIQSGYMQMAGSGIVIRNDSTATVANLKTWLGSNNVSIYYQLATPTETEITNQALIAQLNALLTTARTYAGINNIFTITPNEQGSLEISYYTKYQPVVSEGGYIWEAGGAGGATAVINNSIGNVNPVWTIYGPTNNPVLENTTTGEQIEYVGLIAEGQTLTIDMSEQTASLDGLNVISNVIGDYISLAPGANTLIYSVSGDAGESELGWSEIVG